MAKKKKTFEEYLEQLEAIADELEAGDIPLEEALTKYEEAVKAFRRCQEILKKAELRIEVLLRDDEREAEAGPEGEPRTRPFEPPEAAEASEPAGEAGPDDEETESEDTADELFP